jgi:hypothetical protein
VTVTAASVADPNKSATCAVTVESTAIPVTGVIISPPGPLAIDEGQSKTLTAAVFPPGASQAVTWTTGNPAVAAVTVSADGVVTVIGVAAGTATVTATSVADTTKWARCEVTVNPKPTALSDACEITQYYFTNLDNFGALVMDSSKGGSVANPALINISYLYWTDIPGDGGIAITHTGAAVRPINPEDPDNDTDPGEWEPSGGNFVRYYLVTAENGTTTKHYRVTAVPNFDIHNAKEWQAARTFMSGQPNGTSGSPVVFRPNIVGDFDVPGSNSITGDYKEVRLTGTGTITLSSNGSLIRTNEYQTFVIDGPSLQGKAGNSAALVYIDLNSAVELRSGEIKDNKSSGSFGGGGGVYVSGGTFTMTGGTISGNTITSSSFPHGGGVYVQDTNAHGTVYSGTFTMTGGTISENTATSTGGGVYVRSLAGAGSTFTMTGGTISRNKATNNGGGVYVEKSGSTFTMKGGIISGNTATNRDGGGVFVNLATFIMEDGAISGNTAVNGGGVNVVNKATFTMTGGTISENTAASMGGGVYVNPADAISASIFTMNNGTIRGNAAGVGGGVYANGNYATFTKTGGTIYGDTDNIADNGNAADNTATDTANPGTNGHAVMLQKTSPAAYYYRNETLTGADNLSTTDPLPGGSGLTAGKWTMR